MTSARILLGISYPFRYSAPRPKGTVSKYPQRRGAGLGAQSMKTFDFEFGLLDAAKYFVPAICFMQDVRREANSGSGQKRQKGSFLLFCPEPEFASSFFYERVG